MKQVNRSGAFLPFSATARRACTGFFFSMLAISYSDAQQIETADAHLNHAHELASAGDLKGAIAEYQAAIRLAPNSVEALNSLAALYATASDKSLRNPQQAMVLALKVASLDNGKDDPDHLDTLAKAYNVNGDYPNAVAIEQKAILMLPEDSTRRHGFETSLSFFELADVPADTASFVPYCASHLEGCRQSVMDVNNTTMINEMSGAKGCTFPRPANSGLQAYRANSREATQKILDWMNASIPSLAPKSDDAIQQAIAALWPSECVR
jgi:tetratricopeptide (TPR) repeat protein